MRKIEEICPTCNESFKNVGTHWRWSPSHRPEFTPLQEDIITGVLMGDGSIYRSNKTPYLRVKMITKEYLEYLENIFGILTTGISLVRTSEESARSCRLSGLDENASAENYSDIYELRVRSHPRLEKYSRWYDSGKKVWPKNIELTPTVLKHWYCCDGTYHGNHIEIGMCNERDRTDIVSSYFNRLDLPEPSNYNTSNGTCIAEFSVDDSKKLFDYMGDPLPGFEYKWSK